MTYIITLQNEYRKDNIFNTKWNYEHIVYNLCVCVCVCVS